MTPDAIEQAAARVRRMQEQSRRLVAEHPVGLYHHQTLSTPPPDPEPPHPLACTAPSPDTERWLVLLLAAVLYKNGASVLLLFALLYIAL